MNFHGTSGNDHLTGTKHADTFNLSQGGDDTASGKGGNDTFIFGDTFTGDDHVDGGKGIDTVKLDGDYSSAVNLQDDTLVSVEKVLLAAGNDYSFKVAGNVTDNRLTVDGHLLGTGNSLSFDGSAETNGLFQLIGGAGDDVLAGGSRVDTFWLTHGGEDAVNGGNGNDTINMGPSLDTGDLIDGGHGRNTMTLTGDYSTELFIGRPFVRHVQNFILGDGFNYNLDFDRREQPSGSATIDASKLDTGHSVTLHVTGPGFILIGGAGDDLMFGGTGTDGAANDLFDLTQGGNDTVHGGGGIDTINMGATLAPGDHIFAAGTINLDGDYSSGLTIDTTLVKNVGTIALAAGHDYTFQVDSFAGVIHGDSLGKHDHLVMDGSSSTSSVHAHGGHGADTFTASTQSDVFDLSSGGHDALYYDGASYSPGTAHDYITGFNTALDKFHLDVSVNAIDGGVSGSISENTIDSDLGAAINDALGAHDAILVTATGGSDQGQVFLVVDADGSASYSAGSDYVFDVTGMTGTLTTANFVSSI